MIVKELESYTTNQQRTLVKSKTGKLYEVSSVDLNNPMALMMDTFLYPTNTETSETMIFASDGNKTDYKDLWLTRPRDHEAGILAAENDCKETM